MNFKHTAILATTLMMGLSSTLPAWAQGGDDPIPGIDIIIKEDPSLQPVTRTSVSGKQIERLNEMKVRDKSKYLAEIIVHSMSKGNGAGKTHNADITSILRKQGCPMDSWEACQKPFSINVGEVKYTIQLRIEGVK